jgi:hypothetical protein
MDPVIEALLTSVLQVLLPFLILGVVAVGVVLLPQAVNYIRLRVGEKRWQVIENLVAQGVRAAEQNRQLTTGPEKRAFAVRVMDGLFTYFKIKLPGELAVALVEAVLAKEKMLNGLESVRYPFGVVPAKQLQEVGSEA